jgi:hypothetical protein
MGKPVHRLELYDKVNCKYTGFDIVDWIHLTQGREQLLVVVVVVVILVKHSVL